MSFPTSPVNGQTSVVNGITYSYSTSTTAWTRVAGQVTATTYLSITSNTGASSTTTGALQIVGGVGVGGGMYVGGTITATNFVGSMAGTASAATNVAGGVKDQIPYQTGAGATGFSSGLTFNGTTFTATNIVVPGVTNATSTLTGALQVAGGLAVGKDLYVGGTLIIAGGAGGDIDMGGGDILGVGKIMANTGTFTTTNITSTLGVTSTNTGALQVAGGVGVGGGMYVGGVLTATNIFVGGYAVSTASSLTIQSGGVGQGTAGTVNFSTGLSASVTANVATVTLTTGTLMTAAVNLAGGTSGQLAYQTAAGATGFAGPGTAGQILVSAGTSAPTYTNTGSIYVGNAAVANILNPGNTSTQQVGFAKNLLGNGAGNGALVYQSGPDTTAFLGQGTAGWLLVSGGAGAVPAFTSTASIYVNSAVNAETLRGGAAGQIPYQSAAGVTAFANSGTTGQFLQATTNGAPVFTSTGSMYVGNAAVANTLNAGNTSTQQVGFAANVLGGAAGSLPYQSGANATAFLAGGTDGQSLRYFGTAPVWSSTGTFSGGTNNSNGVANQSVTITSGGLGVTGHSYFSAAVTAGGALRVNSTSGDTGTNTSNALYVAGGAWIDKTLVVQGDVTFKGNAVFQGTTTNVISTNTYYTDNILELHVPPTGVNGQWSVDDGKDIGFRFHYYAGADNNAALVLSNATKYLEWYETGSELTNGTFSTATYGTFQTGRINLKSTEGVINTQTGALRVSGGVGVGGNMYVGGVITATSFIGSFSGTASKANNIVGGTAGQLVYQSTTDTTGFVGPGTAGQILVSGGTSTPVYTSTGSIYVGNAAVANILNAGNTSTQQVGFAANVLAGSAGQMPYQSTANTTAFINSGTTGQFLQGTTNGAPVFTNTGSMYVNSAVNANNIIGGATNQIPYQSGAGATTFGSGLTYNGTTFTTGNISVTGNTNSTSTATGALQVVGGVGIGGNINVGGNILPSVANSQDLGSAALPFRTLYLSSSTLVIGTAQLAANNNGYLTTPAILVTGTNAVTNTTTGAIQVVGGVGIGGGLFVGGTITATNTIVYTSTIGASSTNTGALIVAGGAGFGGGLYVGGTVTATNTVINGTTNSTGYNNNTGALQVRGGAAINNDLWVGGDINLQGSLYLKGVGLDQITSTTGTFVNLVVTGTNATVSTTTGALTIAGGVGVGGGMYVGGTITATNIAVPSIVISGGTNATSTLTGALQVAGGVAIGKDLYIGGTLTVAGAAGGDIDMGGGDINSVGKIIANTGTFTTTNITSTLGATSTNTGALQVVGGVGIAGGLFVGGIITATNISIGGYALSTSSALTIQSGGVGQGNAGTINFSTGLSASVTANVATVTLNTATVVTTAVNLAGGTTGQFAYQTGAGATAFVSTGSIYVGNAVNSQNLLGGTTGQFAYQTGAGATAFVSTSSMYVNGAVSAQNLFGGTTGQFAYQTGAGATAFVSTGSMYVGNAAVANALNAANTSTQQVGFAKNLLGNGAGNGALVYQSAADTTAFLGQGSAGWLLVSGGAGSAPAFTSTASIYVDSAVKANNIIGGSTNQIPYQTGAGATTFGSGLTYNGTTFSTGNITVTGNTNASSTITGAFQVVGGAGIGGNLFIGGSAYLAGDLYVDGTSFTVNSNSIATGDKTLTLSTGSGSAALAANSGLQIGSTSTAYASWLYDGSAYWVSAGSNAGGIKATATTGVTSTTTGALVVAGGAGFGGNLFVGGVVTATSFVGTLAGTSALATTATNLAGGTAGQFAYQTGPGATAFVSTGSIYVGNSVNSQNLLGGTTGQFAYQTGAGATAFVSTGSMYVNGAVSAQNLFGGTTGQFAYQTGAGATAFVSTGSMYVGNAAVANVLNAANTSTQQVGYAANLLAGAAGSLPYQSSANTTAFLAGGTVGQFLRYGSGNAPVWSSTGTFSGGTASSSTVAAQSIAITSGGLGVTGASYFSTDVGMGGELNVSGHIVGGGVRSSSTSTVPANAIVGDIWYNTSNDTLYRYTNDGATSYWIDINGPAIANGSAAYITLATLKATVAASTSFADFQSRIAAL